MKLRHLLIAAALLAPFLLRDYTLNNELKYISIAEEALRDGTWFSFYNHGEAYADKPPLYLWIVMLSKLLFGSYQMWFIALASVLPVAGILAVMGRWVREENPSFDPKAADLMLATTGMFLGSALVLRMDMLMCLFIVLAIYTFWRLYRGTARPCHKWLLPVWIFLATFTKGPVGFMMPILVIAVFLAVKGQIRTFGRYMGWRQWALLVGLCVAWWALVYIEGGAEYINNLLFHQTIGRGIDSFHHKRPWWYYIAHIPQSFAPWVFLLVGVLGVGAWRKLVRTDLERLFMVAITATFVMLSIFSSKLDIYLVPIYPFVVYLAMLWLPQFENRKWVKWAAGFAPAVFVLLLPAAVVADVCNLIPIEYESLAWAYVALAVLFGGSAMALWKLHRNEVQQSIVWSSGALLAMILFATPAIPQFNPQMGVGEVAAEAVTVAEKEGIEHFAFYRFRSGENMDVYLGKVCERIDNTAQLDSLDRQPQRTILFIDHKDPQRDSLLAQWLDRREQRAVGNHSFTIVGGSAFGSGPLFRTKTIDKEIRSDIAPMEEVKVDSTKLIIIE